MDLVEQAYQSASAHYALTHKHKFSRAALARFELSASQLSSSFYLSSPSSLFESSAGSSGAEAGPSKAAAPRDTTADDTEQHQGVETSRRPSSRQRKRARRKERDRAAAAAANASIDEDGAYDADESTLVPAANGLNGGFSAPVARSYSEISTDADGDEGARPAKRAKRAADATPATAKAKGKQPQNVSRRSHVRFDEPQEGEEAADRRSGPVSPRLAANATAFSDRGNSPVWAPASPETDPYLFEQQVTANGGDASSSSSSSESSSDDSSDDMSLSSSSADLASTSQPHLNGSTTQQDAYQGVQRPTSPEEEAARMAAYAALTDPERSQAQELDQLLQTYYVAGYRLGLYHGRYAAKEDGVADVAVRAPMPPPTETAGPVQHASNAPREQAATLIDTQKPQWMLKR